MDIKSMIPKISRKIARKVPLQSGPNWTRGQPLYGETVRWEAKDPFVEGECLAI